jgi:hypothetical protein
MLRGEHTVKAFNPKGTSKKCIVIRFCGVARVCTVLTYVCKPCHLMLCRQWLSLNAAWQMLHSQVSGTLCCKLVTGGRSNEVP